MISKAPVIAIAAGGTGGHIFPAIATGVELKAIFPEATIVYACGERPLEIDLYKRNGIEPVIFPAKQLRAGIFGKVSGVIAAASNVLSARQWLKRIQADVVIGFGGYVSGPTVLAGKFAGCKTAIHEANSVPGKTNRILGRWMDLTASHFDRTLKVLGGRNPVALGMPIRRLKSAETQKEARETLGLDPDVQTLLIMGGSQGAKFLYEAILARLQEIDQTRKQHLQILWSTGETNLQPLQTSLETLPLKNISVKLVPFVNDMGNALKAADLVIARAGASALAELISFRVFTIYVPYPAAIYDHQTLNAREAESIGAGIVIPEPQVSSRIVEAVEKSFARLQEGNQFTVPEIMDSTYAAEKLAREIGKLIS